MCGIPKKYWLQTFWGEEKQSIKKTNNKVVVWFNKAFALTMVRIERFEQWIFRLSTEPAEVNYRIFVFFARHLHKARTPAGHPRRATLFEQSTFANKFKSASLSFTEKAKLA